MGRVGFLDLPAELRNDIYSLLVLESAITSNQLWYRPMRCYCPAQRRPGLPALFDTCKQIRREGACVFLYHAECTVSFSVAQVDERLGVAQVDERLGVDLEKLLALCTELKPMSSNIAASLGQLTIRVQDYDRCSPAGLKYLTKTLLHYMEPPVLFCSSFDESVATSTATPKVHMTVNFSLSASTSTDIEAELYELERSAVWMLIESIGAVCQELDKGARSVDAVARHLSSMLEGTAGTDDAAAQAGAWAEEREAHIPSEEIEERDTMLRQAVEEILDSLRS